MTFRYDLQGSQECNKPNFDSALSANFCIIASDIQVLWGLKALGIKQGEEINASEKALIEYFESDLKFVNGS